jgi:peptidoglycan/LPS O-acetylase OafA/YrhL
MSLLIGIMTLVIKKDRWEMLLFYCGMFIAELDLILPSSKQYSGISSLRSRSYAAAWISLAIISMYLMSQPDQFYDETPGYIWLSSIIPTWFSEKYRYNQTLGSITLVLAVNRLPMLQRPFNLSVVQYFGKISYALYLMHGPIMHVFGYLIQDLAWKLTGVETEGAYVVGFLIGAAVNIPLVIWAADLFWRAVDAPSVKFARWVEQSLLVDELTSSTKELPR